MQNTVRMVALYEQMTIAELADQLEELDDARRPDGWSPRLASHRATVERRVVDRVLGASGDDSLRCEMAIVLSAGTRAARARVRAIGAGGVIVGVEPGWREGEAVELSLPRAALKVRGAITGLSTRGVRVRLAAGDDASERRVRRFVLEALRHRTAWTYTVDETRP